MFSRLDFQDSSGKMSSHSINALPSYLMERLTLLRYFAQYMDENLTEGGDSQSGSTAAAPAVGTPRCRPSFVHMKRWVRTPKAIIMQLDNNTLQVTTTPPFLDCCEIPLMDCNSFFLSSPFLSHFLSVPVDQLFQGPHENCALRFDWAFVVRFHPLLGDLHQQWSSLRYLQTLRHLPARLWTHFARETRLRFDSSPWICRSGRRIKSS